MRTRNNSRSTVARSLRAGAQTLLVTVILPGLINVPCFGQNPAPSPTPVKQTSPPQQKPTPPTEPELDVVKISTNLVQIDAVVTDRSGKRITDLSADEVEMQEDGKAQKITNFSYIDFTSKPADRSNSTAVDRNAPAPPPVRLRPEQVHRTIALVVDDLGLSFESAYYVRRALKKFIDEQMQPDDLVAIVRTGGGIGALQQFTSDKRQLYAAAEKVKWNPIGRASISAFAPIGNDPATLPGGTDDGTSGETPEDLDQFREDIFAVGTLGAVNYVVRGLRELPGRKSIILLSDGLKIFNRSDPFGNVRILSALRQLTDLANRASVVIYTMDARGLQPLGLTAADSTSGMTPDQVEQSLSDRRADFFESQNGLAYLADRTGGIAFRNNNDLVGGIKRVIEDQQGYYLIGYRPDESTFEKVNGRSKFHKISLKIKRPGKFSVRMRNGFYGISDELATERKATPQQQLVSALVSPFSSNGIQLRLTSLFANDPKVGSFMRSFLNVNAKDLTFTAEPDGTHKAVLDILAVTFGDNGLVVDQVGRRQTITLTDKSYERVLKGGITYNMTVPIRKAGAYQMRTALRDAATERVGSATQFIEVPDFKKNRLLLSGIVLKGMPLEVYMQGKPAAQQGADNTVEETNPNSNPAVRQFPNGFALAYGFTIYNAQIDKPTGKPQLKIQVRIFRNGQKIFSGNEVLFDPTAQSDPKRLVAGGGIQLGNQMTPGEYVFQIVVTDLLAKEKYRVATQWMDFEVVK